MVERPSTSAMRRNMYIPEDRPGYAEYIADPENQQKAQDAALNLAALLSGPIGEIPAGLRLARQILGGSKLLERGQQYFARPDGGNARLPEEMLQPTLPAPPAQQAVPPFRSPGQLGYSPTTRPTRDDRMGRIEGEGGFDPQAIAQAQRARTERERGEQRQDISRLEGEGGTTADTVQMARDVHNRRVAQERAQREMELSRFEGEGGREGRSFSRDFTFEGPSYYNYPPPVRFNEAGVPVAGGRPVTNDMPLFTQGEHGIPSLSYSPKNSGALMERPSSDMVPPPRLVGSQKGGESTGPFFGAGSSNSYGRNQYMDDIAEVSTALRPSIVGTTQIINSPVGNYRPETPTSNAPANTAGGYEFQFRAPTITPADLFDMRGDHPLPPPRPAGLVATPAPQRAPAPKSVVTTPPPAEGNDSILNRIFSGKDYQSARGQVEQATPEGRKAINWGDPDNAADFFRADKAMRAAQSRGEDVTGMATGGSAKPHKDASLHKALEIIHSLISSR